MARTTRRYVNQVFLTVAASSTSHILFALLEQYHLSSDLTVSDDTGRLLIVRHAYKNRIILQLSWFVGWRFAYWKNLNLYPNLKCFPVQLTNYPPTYALVLRQ